MPKFVSPQPAHRPVWLLFIQKLYFLGSSSSSSSCCRCRQFFINFSKVRKKLLKLRIAIFCITVSRSHRFNRKLTCLVLYKSCERFGGNRLHTFTVLVTKLFWSRFQMHASINITVYVVHESFKILENRHVCPLQPMDASF